MRVTPGASRDEVVTLAEPSPGLDARRDLLRRALLPASVTDDWAGAAVAADALVGQTLLGVEHQLFQDAFSGAVVSDQLQHGIALGGRVLRM